MDLDAWIKEVSGGKSRISRDEEKRLIHLYKNGTLEEREYAKAELLAYNVLPIVNIALEVYHTFPNAYRMDIHDLIHRGVEVFLSKLDKFDPEKARLITFYSRDVKTQMQRMVMKYATAVAQGSVFLQHIASKKSKVYQNLQQKLNREPTDEEVAEALGIDLSTLKIVDRYTLIKFQNLPEPDYTNIAFKESLEAKKLLSILREKLEFLTDEEFEQLIEKLISGESPDEHLVQKTLNYVRGGD